MKAENKIEEKILLNKEDMIIKLFHNITTDTYILYKDIAEDTIIFDNNFNQIILNCVIEFVYEENGRVYNYRGFVSDIENKFININEYDTKYYYKNIHSISVVEIER